MHTRPVHRMAGQVQPRGHLQPPGPLEAALRVTVEDGTRPRVQRTGMAGGRSW